MDKFILSLNPWERSASWVSEQLAAKFKDWPEPRQATSGALCPGCIVESREERRKSNYDGED